ncbi:MAG: transglutaminase domain-containing protein [Cyclobacteriaceae bacterium]
MKIILFLTALAVSLNSFGQKPPAKFGDIPMEDMKMTIYPLDSSAEAVVLVDYGTSTISYGQTEGFQLFYERLWRLKILKKEGLKWADFSIPLYHIGDSEEKITSLKVVTYNLENGKIIETKSKSDSYIKQKYDENLTFTKVAWNNVREGSIIEISYKMTSDFTFNFQDWSFQSEIPTRWSEYRAKIPQYFNYERYMQGYVSLFVTEQEVSHNSFTVSYTTRSGGAGWTPVSSSTNQQRVDYEDNIYRWAVKEAPAFKLEPYMTSSHDYISKINFELSFTNFTHEFSNPGVKHYMGTWGDISKAYWERVGPMITGNNSLKNQVDEITAGLATPAEKVASIFNFVRQSILWNGENRKYPSDSPKKIFEDKKGNSADVNILLCSMLEKAEINVRPVLLSTRDHGFVRESIPVSTQFNYVVCNVKLGEKNILLDATDRLLPVGLLPEKCLNGSGLAVSADGFEWLSLLPVVKTKEIYNFDLVLTDASELKGTLKLDNTGYNAMEARKTYFEKEEQGYIKGLNQGRSWAITKSEFINLKDIQQPLQERHEITISEHMTEAGNTTYLSPFMVSNWNENPFKQKERTYPVDFGHPFDEIYIAKITIPENYVVDELPKSKVMMLPENAARYTYNIAQSGNTITIGSTLSINKSLFLQTEYPNLREFYNQMIAKQSEQIVLKKK